MQQSQGKLINADANGAANIWTLGFFRVKMASNPVLVREIPELT